MKALTFTASSLLALLIVLMGGCSDKTPDGPVNSLGNVAVNKYVAIGNSLTAGYQSNGLYESAQIYSFPNLIAQQLKAAGANIGQFEQPLWADPGALPRRAVVRHARGRPRRGRG